MLCYKQITLLFSMAFTISCGSHKSNDQLPDKGQSKSLKTSSIVVLGTTQDAGSPQIGCKKSCCKALFDHPDETRKVTSLGLVDVPENKTYLFDASPDIVSQMEYLMQFENDNSLVEGIF